MSTNDWSPRYKDVSDLDEAWGMYDFDATIESLTTDGAMEIIQRIVDDYRAFNYKPDTKSSGTTFGEAALYQKAQETDTLG